MTISRHSLSKVRTLILASLVICGAARTNAQVRFDIGVAFAGSNSILDTYSPDLTTTSPDSIAVKRSGGFAAYFYVYPKYHFLSLPAISLSAGAPLAIGVGNSTRQVGDLDDFGGTALAYDASLAVDLNVGIPAPKKMDSRLGAYIGGGIGIQRTGQRLEQTNVFNKGNVSETLLNEDFSSVGYLIHGGLMVRTPRKPVGLGLAIKRPFADGRLTFTTIRMFIPI